MAKIGIIGGSGLDNPDILEDAKDIEVDTPYGKPSSSLKAGKIKGVEVILIARHGREHTIPPTKVNFRANIHALKEAGCTHIFATTACGSLREEINRGHLVIIDQFIDFTRHRKTTFYEKFEPHKPTHCQMAEPFSGELRDILIKSGRELKIFCHEKGTVVTIEGPRFSTKAESKMFRILGADLINMSLAPEAILANEAGIPYAVVAMSTDYDCWKEDEEPVTWDAVLEIFKSNAAKVTELLVSAVQKVDAMPNIVKSKIRAIPNFPKQGIMYRDITTLLKDKEGFNSMIELFAKRYKNQDIDVIVGIESRGFIIGGAIAHKLGIGFVPLRKSGKLPAETVEQEYKLEYGTDKIEMHVDAIHKGQKVLLVDDLIATGGTAKAACELIEKLGGEIIECAFIVDLPELKGKEKLYPRKVYCMVEFEGG